MISLNPPYLVIDGYTLLPDHADPMLYYVLPPAPQLAQDSEGFPSLLLLEYQGGGPGDNKVEGGVLTLSTELRVPEEKLSDLAVRLANRLGASGCTFRLMPVLFDSGTVEIIAAGAASGDPDHPATQGPFNITFLGSGKPSMGVNNPISFQLMLDPAASDLIDKSLCSPDLPLLVIYRMMLAGLRPSFRVDITADWHHFYENLRRNAKGNAYFVAFDAEKLVTDTLDEQNIHISTDIFGTSESDRADAERARKQLVDWVLDKFFAPAADSKSAMANSLGQVVDDAIWSLARTVLPGISYRLREISEDQLRTLSARMDESVAELREVVPQGTLGGMLHRFRVDEAGKTRADWPAAYDRMVKKVIIDAFPRLEVRVGVEDRFASDGVSEVRVDLARIGTNGSFLDDRTLAFRSATEHKQYTVNLEGAGDFSTLYRYRIAVDFDPAGPYGPHGTVKTDWMAGKAREMVVEPRWAYRVTNARVVAAPTFSFKEFPKITVALRYTGDEGLQAGKVDLDQNTSEGSWSFRSIGDCAPPYEYCIVYHRAPGDGGDIVTPWNTQADSWLFVPDPIPAKRTLNLFFSLDWDQLSLGYLRLLYRDDAHGIAYDDQIDLDPGTRYLRKDYPVSADGPKAMAYRLTLLYKTGILLEGQWRETDDDRLIVDRRLVDVRLIRVKAVGGGLVDNALAAAHIRLRALDPQTGQARADKEFILSPGAVALPMGWEYLPGDPPAIVQYGGYFVDRDGFVTDFPWKTLQTDLVTVDLKTRSLNA